MTALIVIGAILLFFWLIGMLRANLIVAYDGQFRIKMRVLFFTIPITPKRQKKPPNPEKYSPKKYRKMRKKAEKKADKKQRRSDKKAARKKKKKADADAGLAKAKGSKDGRKKRNVSDILELVGQLLGAVRGLTRSFGKHLRIEAVRMKITVAAEDAAQTALLYGAVCEGVACLLELLSALTNFKAKHREEISVEPDFLSEKSTADLHLVFRLRVWHVFAMLFSAFSGFIRKKLQSNKE